LLLLPLPLLVMLLAPSVKVPLMTRLFASVRPAASARSVPVVRVSVPVPKALLLAAITVGPLRKVVPEYPVLLPRMTTVPVPFWFRYPEPPPARFRLPVPLRVPARVVTPVLVTVNVFVNTPAPSPVLLKLIDPAKVRLLLPLMVTLLLFRTTA